MSLFQKKKKKKNEKENKVDKNIINNLKIKTENI